MRRTSALVAALAGAAAAAVAAGCGGSSPQEHARPAAGHSTTFKSSTAWPKAERKREHKPPDTPRPQPVAPRRPPIVDRPIPFGAKRREEMAAYSLRHYGQRTWRLTDPHVIVEHYTASSDFSSAYNTFASDTPDVELHELPGTCSHFVIDRDGTIYRLVPTTVRCRHTVGLNYTAIGIEHVGLSDEQVIGDPAELHASLRLTRWLRCSYGIRIRDVIGHNESLSSPYHRELVASLRTQTHGDMQHTTMVSYRRRLAALGC